MKNHHNICGIDEAGRGALAGPLFASAVFLTKTQSEKLNRSKHKIIDSKLLRPAQRKTIIAYLKGININIEIEIISTRSINNHGIGWANKEIIRRLVRKVDSNRFIIDGNLKLGRFRKKIESIKSIPKADSTHLPVILAGIIAKHHRDMYMQEISQNFPQYGWEQNAGYGTKKHIKEIINSGPTRYHRNIFVHTAINNHQINQHKKLSES
ncbi:ribonuclease HII [Patescibacteria group bacterium]